MDRNAITKGETLGTVATIKNDWVDLSKPLVLDVWDNYDRVNEKPIIVGGMPGSGTRVMAWLLEMLDVYMGWTTFDDYLLGTRDAIPIGWWAANYAHFALQGMLDTFTPGNWERCFRSLDIAMNEHLQHRKNERFWGWKQPSSMHCVDLLAKHLPNMKYIHIVRDGRDISDEWKNLFEFTYGENNIVFPEGMTFDDPVEVRYMAIWAHLHMDTLVKLRDHVKPGNYFIIRFEDMVTDPEAMLKALKGFVGARKICKTDKFPLIVPPPTLGRWKRDDYVGDVSVMSKVCQPVLEKFGYDT